MTGTDIKEAFLEFAVETAQMAGKMTLETFQKTQHSEIKADGSIVTETDKRVEQFIRGRIQDFYPEHNVLGEEFGQEKKGKEKYRWIIDPIDGTVSFASGVPLYAVLIALEIEGKSRIGVAYYPALNEMLFAAEGMGCHLNGQLVHVDDTICSVKEGITTITDYRSVVDPKYKMPLTNIISQSKQVRGWGDAYGYLLIARGQTTLHLDAVMKIWDCAPFLPILKEAGGYFGDWEGNETIGCKSSMATTRRLLPEVVQLLNQEKEVKCEVSNL